VSLSEIVLCVRWFVLALRLCVDSESVCVDAECLEHAFQFGIAVK
jgi:hypothetical protein